MLYPPKYKPPYLIIFSVMLANFLFTQCYSITGNDFLREIYVVIRTHELSYPHPQGHIYLRLSSLSYNVRLVIIIIEFPPIHGNLFCSPQLSLLMRITWTMYHSSNLPLQVRSLLRLVSQYYWKMEISISTATWLRTEHRRI